MGDSNIANSAIAAKYAELGGATGFLGPSKTQLIADSVAGGFHIDYTHGSIYWSKPSGAHAIYGQIYAKWIQLGGPNGILGYPTTDEAPTADKKCRFNKFTKGENFDWGAIYWTSQSGAHAIYGQIYYKWVALGGYDKSNIGYSTGYPITDEASTPDNVARFNNFSNGCAIYWTGKDGAHIIYGEIFKKWNTLGGYKFGIGYPIADEAGTPDNAARFSNFSNAGAIYWTGKDGAHVIYGNIYRHWNDLGGYKLGIGYPITDEAATPDNVCRFSNFSNGGAIYWTGKDGAHVIYGEIYRKWVSLGGEQGSLGYPITDETSSGSHGGRYNDFTGGTIYWSPNSGCYEHIGPLPTEWGLDHSCWFEETISGEYHVKLYSDGTVHWWGRFHADGWPSYDEAVGVGMRDADGQAYQLSHSGHVGGKIETASATDPWDLTDKNPAIAANWRAIIANMQWRGDARVNSSIIPILSDILKIINELGPVVGTVISLL